MYTHREDFRFVENVLQPNHVEKKISGGVVNYLEALCILQECWRREKKEKKSSSRRKPLLCVCVFSSHSFWTSSSLGHTRFFIHFLSAVRALIFLARRIVGRLIISLFKEISHYTKKEKDH